MTARAAAAAFADSQRTVGRAVIRVLSRGEDLVLAIGLALIAALPVAEVIARTLFETGLPGSAVAVQHLALVVSILGTAVAARERRLLVLSTSKLIDNYRWAPLAAAAAAVVGVVVCTALAVAGARLALAEREFGAIAAYGIPVWSVQLVLPLGFAVIGVRLLWQGTCPGRARWASAAIAACVFASVALWAAPDSILIPGLAALAVAIALGTPIFVIIGGVGLLLFWTHGLPIASVALDHYRLVVNPTMPAVPLFTLAGYLLAESGAPTRLVRVFEAAFGRFRAGAVLVTVLTCTFFTCFTGASGVTVLAVGGLLLPLLASARVNARPALGLVTGGGSPGVMLAPSLPLILYAIVAKIPIDQMFLAGLLPATLMVIIAMGWGISRTPRCDTPPAPFDWRELLASAAAAKWELGLPALVFGALFGGLASPVEAAAITAVYVLFVVTVANRDLSLKADVPRVIAEAGSVIGGILIVLGMALGLASFLVDIEIPERAVEMVTAVIDSRWAFLIALNVMLLAVGCVVDIFSAIVVLAPILVPVGVAFGVDPLHLGIIFLANLELGYLTPPVGLNLYYAATRFKVDVTHVYGAVTPLFVWLACGVVLITFAPWLSTALPALFAR